MDQIYDELRAALHSIWHRRWVALVVAWLVSIAGWLVVAMIPNSYESSGRIYVQLYDPIATQMGMSTGDRQHDIERVRDTLTSSVHLAKVINQTRLGQGITTQKQMENAIAALGRSIRVTNDQDNLFEIDATSGSMALSDRENAELARDIVVKMIDIFHAENANGSARDVTDTVRFVDEQLAQREKDLNAAQQRRAVFEAQHPELAQGGVSLVQRLEQDRAEERNLDSDIAAAQGALSVANGQLAGTPRSLPGGAAQMGGAHAQLAQAQSQLAAMHARGLTDDHPDVIAMRNEISALRVQANAEGSPVSAGVPNPAYATLVSEQADRQATLTSLQARRASLEGDIAKANAQQASDPTLVTEAQNISRDTDVLKQQYDKLLQDREDLRLKGQVTSAHDSVKFQVIDPPTMPRGPNSPNRPLLLVLVLAVGIASGIGAAFVIGELRATFATTAKLARATSLPVLGAITHISGSTSRLGGLRRMQGFLAGVVALFGVFVLLMAMEFIQRSMLA